MSVNLEKRVADPEIEDTTEMSSSAMTLLHAIETSRIELFLDHTSTPCICIPREVGRQIWPLNHPRVEAWVAALCQPALNEIPKRRDIHDVLRVLAGRAWENPNLAHEDETHLWAIFEAQPLLQAVDEFLSREPHARWEGMTKDLRDKLDNFAVTHWINRAHSSWPKSTRMLSQRLGKLELSLRALNIRFERSHTRDGSFAVLERLPSSDAGDAAEFRASPVHHEPDLGRVVPNADGDASDAGDANFTKLRTLNRIRRLRPAMSLPSGNQEIVSYGDV